jgi:hypothetical protein
MKGRHGKQGIWLGCLLALLLAARAEAVLFEFTGDPTYNTTAPSGTLTNSGWQYEGQWQGSHIGTPIAPTFFLAAQHIGGSVGDLFGFNGLYYHTVAFFDCPNSDLRVCQVAETFPNYAPLYTGSNEVGQLCVVIGRGTQRGPPVIVNGSTNGWMWGATDGVQRWGDNVVSGIYTDANQAEYVEASFVRNADSNQCDLSVGDSSGGMFIQDNGTWKLAGIHYEVEEGPYSYDGMSNTEFIADMMDLRGLYYQSGPNSWTLVPSNGPPVSTFFISSRVSAHAAWIYSVINFQPGNDLQITGVQLVGPDAQVNLVTGSNRVYRVDHISDLATGVWTAVTNNLTGTGGIVPVVDPGAAAQPQQFYRATILQ